MPTASQNLLARAGQGNGRQPPTNSARLPNVPPRRQQPSQRRLKDHAASYQGQQASLPRTTTRGRPGGKAPYGPDQRGRSGSPVFKIKSPGSYRNRSPRPPTSPVPSRPDQRQPPLRRKTDHYEPAQAPRYARETLSSSQKRRQTDKIPHPITQKTPPSSVSTSKPLADCSPRELRERLRRHGLMWARNEKDHLIAMLQACEREYEAGYAEILKYLGDSYEADEFGRRAAQNYSKERVEADRIQQRSDKQKAKEEAMTSNEDKKEDESLEVGEVVQSSTEVKALKRKRSQNSDSGNSSLQLKASSVGSGPEERG